MDREYTAADITVLSFEDSVRKRTGMYFAVAPNSPDLPTNIVRGVIDDALHSARASAHHTFEIEVTGDLRFTVADDQPPALDERGEPKQGFYGSMIDKARWALAAAAALSTHTLIEIRAGGRGWRQELTGSIPTLPEPFAAPDESDGTRVALELDAAFLATDAAISTSPDRLQPRGTGCATCAGTPRATTLTIKDRR
jgi:DNA gyrase/topoisomerase IV subunit B